MQWEWERPDQPEGSWWPQTVTPEEFAACVPERIELIDGHICGDANTDEVRLNYWPYYSRIAASKQR